MLALLAAAPAAALDPALARDPEVLAERRRAAGYVRTGNADLAALALERLSKALGTGPEADRVGDALAAIDAGDLARAGELLETLADQFAAVRAAAGVPVFADCIRAVSRAHAPLDAFRTRRPDLADAAVRRAVAAAAAASAAVWARCDAEAPAATAADADFRRLVDGARASLARVPPAAESGDGDLLHRFLIELRSFEQLLLFRFG